MTLHVAARFALLAGILLGAAPARAQWIPDGTPVCTASGLQYGQTVVPDGAGGALIAWTDERAGTHVYVQHLTAAGALAAGWPLNGLAVTGGTRSQHLWAAVSDGAGGVLLAWEDSRNNGDVWAQRITGAGGVAPGWPAAGLSLCGLLGLQTGVAAIPDGAGGIIVTWQDWRDFLQPDLYAQRVDGAGVPLWAANGVSLCLEPHHQYPGAAAPDGAGGAWIVWDDLRAGEDDIYVQHLSAAGVPAPGFPAAGRPVCAAADLQLSPTTAADGAGGCVIAWADRRGGGWSVYAQRLLADGSPAPGWNADGNLVRAGLALGPPAPQLAIDGLGGAFVLWGDQPGGPGQADLFAQRMTGSGTRAWDPAGVVVAAAPFGQYAGGLVADGSGGIYAVWSDQRGGGGDDIYAARFKASGQLAPGWLANGSPLAIAPLVQSVPVAAPDGFGGAIVVWQDDRSGDRDLHALRTVMDGPVPVALALLAAEATPGLAHLAWLASGGDPALEATLERRTPVTDWSPRATLLPDGSGRLAYEDRDVEPGGRYGYRLRVRERGVESLVGEAWVTIPATLALALEGARPNPARGVLTVAFMLPDGAAAHLMLLDLAGRRIAALEVGSLGAGRHVAALGGEAPLAPGLYLVRLERGGVALTTRALVIR
ncbi:MAG: hypothetical protein A2W00_15615 [Candidatus Eisenbacteria bacterium RBG_16_71_46]|nr:MAG: hypothetical protein A2W00_15615 [Candidatus Eisenbacteria bacterium RBG_16_71_46]